MEKHSFLKQCLKLLETEGLTEEMLAVRASRLLESGRLASYNGQVYCAATARTEQNLAWAVCRMLRCTGTESSVGIDTEIAAEEKRQGIQLAAEQRQAVMTALTSPLSVITGGPGTGKTLIQRFLLDIYRRRKRGAKIISAVRLQGVRHAGWSSQPDFRPQPSTKRLACWPVRTAATANRRCWTQI